ncbi:hypothetical protein Kalk_20820 [Ketobacter alkanivorans]|uniref:Uncharacterized protein n=1 Tax=Ketobacter alkanivorans TaxID=1917421 RepID=A0A2K9LR04_9GAMM|nr:hypothetical protein Kalk_20820 [Ketobacter alkanivorans]
MPKSACFPPMEIADFIAHTCGAQARVMRQGKAKERKDFKVIFKSINEKLTSFMHITNIKYSDA